MNLLFTSAGRRVELLRCIRKASQTLGLPARIVATDIDPLAPALHFADVACLMPRLNDDSYPAALATLLERERIDVVFPLIDPDIPVLSKQRELLERTGTRLAVVPLPAVAITADKWLTNQFFDQLNVPRARSWLPGELDCHAVRFPLVVKPRHGSASQGVSIARSAEELDFFSRYVKNPIVQEFLAGPEITNDVVCDLEGNVLSVVSRQRMRVREGEVAIGRTVFDAKAVEHCVRIARALPAVGPITVQYIMNEGTPTFTEINARFGGGCPVGAMAGAEWPMLLLARLAGRQVEIPPLGSYRKGMYFSRFDETLGLDEAALERVAKCAV
jgi:carbamoyl-phosphate synthase large subunit